MRAATDRLAGPVAGVAAVEAAPVAVIGGLALGRQLP